ncbi:MAG: phosphotransferase [candidate division Zixibacteria bacterium]|nr:phosphotransferase [candidate division Zixibacteria bacterium]
MPKTDNMPTEKTITYLLKTISPGSTLKSISEVEGSYSNYTHLIEAEHPGGIIERYIIRRYAIFSNYDRGEKARREYKTLEFAYENGIPAPKPVYLDETGLILKMPGIVTEYVDGKSDLNPRDPIKWAEVMAETLAKIHSLPRGIEKDCYVLDANQEASWFLRDDGVPDFMKNYPRGMDVLKAAFKLHPKLKKTEPCLVHIDYWPGNILWKDDRIVAVVDWEEAAYGDPIIDVAYARMEISILGFKSAAERFLETYVKLTGKPAANLLFWELAAAARPMYSPETWNITESPRRDRFDKFVERILDKTFS